MTAAARRVFEEALALSDSEREELVEVLSRSLQPVEISEQWRTELARRIEKIESGEAVLHDAESHVRMLRAKFG